MIDWLKHSPKGRNRVAREDQSIANRNSVGKILRSFGSLTSIWGTLICCKPLRPDFTTGALPLHPTWSHTWAVSAYCAVPPCHVPVSNPSKTHCFTKLDYVDVHIFAFNFPSVVWKNLSISLPESVTQYSTKRISPLLLSSTSLKISEHGHM